MATVRTILDRKGSHVHTVTPSASVLEAAKMMNEHKIGALVVIEEGRAIGIFTERDVLRRVVAEGNDPKSATVEQVMTREVAYCHSDTKLTEARGVFKNRRIRHLPVLDDDDRLVGMISIGDLNAYESHEQETTIRFLHEYLYGTV